MTSNLPANGAVQSAIRARAPGTPTINAVPITIQPAGLNLGDVYFTLFRHKWKLACCLLLGVASAIAVFKLKAPPFQSEAKLFIRYVISENKALGPGSAEAAAKSPDQRGETIMNSE